MGASSELTLHLEQAFAEKEEILGSALGAAIKRFQPSIDFRREYGGLRNFVDREMAGSVVWVNRKDNDDLYRITTSTPSVEVPPPDTAPVNLWQAFSNPNSSLHLFLEKPDFSAVIHRDDKITEGAIPVPKLTSEDYRECATSFTEDLPTDVQESARAILQSKDYWNEWCKLLMPYQKGHYWRLWGRRRQEFVFAKFEAYLSALDVPASRAKELLTLLKSARTKAKSGSPPRESKEAHAAAIANRDSLFSNDAHEIAKELIGRMPLAELRQIRVSLGEVLDFLSRHSKKPT